mmetsp:Transcript_8871/g.24570  ORF Transcript_8871/g.24570 Transcript_8871/m.24570 type:complete len:173 (-) Transcript_8871:220-738(-)
MRPLSGNKRQGLSAVRLIRKLWVLPLLACPAAPFTFRKTTRQCTTSSGLSRQKKFHDAAYFSVKLFNQLSNGNEDSSDKEADDEDGWSSPSVTTTSYRSAASFIEEEEQQKQQQLETPTRSTGQVTLPPATNEPERDLFIPIFALVSLAGLFGAYGYEMMRLFSRGELYLPF